jgi:citrate synthase
LTELPGHPSAGGVTVLASSISSIDADGLRYRGYRVEELAEFARYEEVAWLLLTGELPTGDEKNVIEDELQAGARVPEAVRRLLALLPADSPPVARVQAALPLLALTMKHGGAGTDDASPGTALRLQGAFAVLAGTALGGNAAAESPPVSAPSTVARLLLTQIRGAAPAPAEVRALERVLILYADHELNASTFTGRVAASTRADLYSSVLAALSALSGPLHGGVDRYVRSMLAAAEQEGAESVVERYLRAGMLLPGFGHSVYRGDDPRGIIMRDLARQLAPASGQTRWLQLTEAIERAARGRGVPPFNVDLYTAVVYRSLGIPDALSTLVFATGRLAGWCAHILEQYADNRLIRPRAAYIGAGPREWPGSTRRSNERTHQ